MLGAMSERDRPSGEARTTMRTLRHEMRTPLGQIIGYSELLEEELQERGQADLLPDLERIRRAARTLLDLRPVDAPAALGLGGGHYVPRHSDVAFARRVAFGHLLSTRVLESADPGILDAAVARTPEARIAYVHRKSLGKADLRAWETRLESLGLRVVREADLDALRAKTS